MSNKTIPTIELRYGRNQQYELFVGGLHIEGVSIKSSSSRGSAKHFRIETASQKATELLTSIALSQFPPNIYGLTIRRKFTWFEFIRSVEIGLHDIGNTSYPREFLGYHYALTFHLMPASDWKGEYSFSEYFRELMSAADHIVHERVFFVPKNKGEVGAGKHALIFMASDGDKTIASEMERCSKAFSILHERTIQTLKARIRKKSIVTLFEFPEEVRAYCEQYLVYFVQFLKDLGVEATSELKHEAGHILFTVTPKDEHEALDKIRTALNVYLHLPSSPVGNDPASEIAIQRLESQVLRLQSDVRLAAAELQAKNATIEAQQLTINVQKALLHGEIFPAPMKQVEPKKEEDREEFLGGAVALTVYKEKGVELSWAKMFKHLRDMFMEKDEEKQSD